ncbi:MAG TPA: MGMT family protein [Acidimicrobiia bacterium]|nr:MGMT family protein [Acidimicrobiia bacterium]
MNIEETLAGLRRGAPASLKANVELGTGLADGVSIFESPVGELAVTFNPHGVSSVSLAALDFEDYFSDRFGRRLIEARPPSGWEKLINRGIEAGNPGQLPLDLRGVTAFRRAVMLIATTIPRGEVRPYQWLARQAGRPGAARAVGSAMANNPIPLIVPCHRVVRSDGSLGAYSLGGSANKRVLLAREGFVSTAG